MFQQIAILGTGLLGSSLLRVARKSQLAEKLTAWSRTPQSRAFCAGRDWCDAVFENAADCVRGADFVIVCVPVDRVADVLAQALPALSPSAIVTDVGSTKKTVCERARSVLGDRCHFVGAHPMAGSEKSGAANGTAELFEGRVCFVTPDSMTPPDAVSKVGNFWGALGMRVVEMTPAAHDEIVAHISHLPHLAAVSLASSLAKCPSRWRDFSGTGLAGTTRISSGEPNVWSAILRENRDNILSAVSLFQDELSSLKTALANDDFDAVGAILSRAKNWRDALEDGK